MLKRYRSLALALAVVAGSTVSLLSNTASASAADCTVQSGIGENFTKAKWSCGHVPGETDNVFVVGSSINVDAPIKINNLTIVGNDKTSGALTLVDNGPTNSSLTVNGNTTVVTNNAMLKKGTSYLSALTVSASRIATFKGNITVSNAIFKADNNITFSSKKPQLLSIENNQSLTKITEYKLNRINVGGVVNDPGYLSVLSDTPIRSTFLDVGTKSNLYVGGKTNIAFNNDQKIRNSGTMTVTDAAKVLVGGNGFYNWGSLIIDKSAAVTDNGVFENHGLLDLVSKNASLTMFGTFDQTSGGSINPQTNVVGALTLNRDLLFTAGNMNLTKGNVILNNDPTGGNITVNAASDLTFNNLSLGDTAQGWKRNVTLATGNIIVNGTFTIPSLGTATLAAGTSLYAKNILNHGLIVVDPAAKFASSYKLAFIKQNKPQNVSEIKSFKLGSDPLYLSYENTALNPDGKQVEYANVTLYAVKNDPKIVVSDPSTFPTPYDVEQVAAAETAADSGVFRNTGLVVTLLTSPNLQNPMNSVLELSDPDSIIIAVVSSTPAEGGTVIAKLPVAQPPIVLGGNAKLGDAIKGNANLVLDVQNTSKKSSRQTTVEVTVKKNDGTIITKNLSLLLKAQARSNKNGLNLNIPQNQIKEISLKLKTTNDDKTAFVSNLGKISLAAGCEGITEKNVCVKTKNCAWSDNSNSTADPKSPTVGISASVAKLFNVTLPVIPQKKLITLSGECTSYEWPTIVASPVFPSSKQTIASSEPILNWDKNLLTTDDSQTNYQTITNKFLSSVAGKKSLAYRWYIKDATTGKTILTQDDFAGNNEPCYDAASKVWLCPLFKIPSGKLEKGKTYRWSIQTGDIPGFLRNSGLPDFGPEQEFRVIPAAPQKPILQSPQNGESLTTLSPKLSWSADTNFPSQTFRLYVQDADTNNKIWERDWTSGTNPSDMNCLDKTNHWTCSYATVPVGLLLYDKPYRWTVEAQNSSGVSSGYAESSQFNIKTTFVPVRVQGGSSAPNSSDGNGGGVFLNCDPIFGCGH